MFAIFVTGGKQYKVSEGDVIFVEKLGVSEGEEVTFDKVLCLNLMEAAKAQTEEKPEAGADDTLTAEIMAQIEARAAAKKAKNYAEADRIRNELAARGITLIDTPQGTTFKIN